jgi:Flp pilus assembly protein TadB
MAGLSRSTCPHGRTPSTPERRAGGSLSWTVAKFGIVAVLALVVLSWAAAFFWAALRILELVAVAVIVGWACWRLGVRHGRRHPE